MSKTPDLDPIVLDDIDPTSEWVEEIEDPVFEADFDFDATAAGGEFEADLVAPSDADPGLVAASSKGKQPMVYCRAPRATPASIRKRSTSIVIGGRDTEVADEPEAKASSEFDPDDVYAVDVDPVSSSGDEFDD